MSVQNRMRVERDTMGETARERNTLSEEELDRLLNPESMVQPGTTIAGAGG